MKYGMNVLLWTGDVTEEHYPILEQIKEMGYDGVELPLFNLDLEKYAKLGKKLDELELGRTAVTVRTAEDNPISPDAAIRQAGVEKNCLTLDCCEAVGATVLCGPYHSALGEFTGQGPTENEFKWGVESMQKMAEHAKKTNVQLAVEYLNRFECYFLNSAKQAVRFVEAVDHPSCKMMYDSFHANIEEKSITEATQAAASHIVHVHISENDRSTPGTGNIRWGETFDALLAIDYDGWMTVEAFGLALPELAAATKIWRRMYETETQLAKDALEFMKSNWAQRKEV
ncbi:Xylose isomerase domain-containing protein TIM barrel [Planctomycetales bacterium 10988]|nr:Xylose isomerase domain-containing protein TIM barrel [Planctomycetales bacterium 10988]